MILRLARRIAPGLDPKTVGDEIRSRIEEELDYELEAQNQRALARIYRGHPFIVVPEVVGSMSRERLLVTEFVEGIGFEELKGLLTGGAQPRRRDSLPLLLRLPSIATTSSPGTRTRANSMLLGDGRMAFFDFGLFKRMPVGSVELEIEVARAIVEGDTETIMERGTEIGFFPEGETFDPGPRARALPRRDLLVHGR